MTLTELIQALKDISSVHGELPIIIEVQGEEAILAAVGVDLDDNDKAVCLLLISGEPEEVPLH